VTSVPQTSRSSVKTVSDINIAPKVSYCADRIQQIITDSRLQTERQYVQLEKYFIPVSTYYAAARLELRNPNTDRRPFKLEIGTPVTFPPGNVHTNFGFLRFFLLSS